MTDYSGILKNGFSQDTSKTPIYMSDKYSVAQNAIFGRYDEVVSNFGVISSKIPENILRQLIESGQIVIRDYSGFGGTMPGNIEYQIYPEAIKIINQYIVR